MRLSKSRQDWHRLRSPLQRDEVLTAEEGPNAGRLANAGSAVRNVAPATAFETPPRDRHRVRASARGTEGGTRAAPIPLVAHRLTAVDRCDRIVFPRQARIDDVGPPDELMARNAVLRAIGTRDSLMPW